MLTVKLFATFRQGRFDVAQLELTAGTTVGNIVDEIGIPRERDRDPDGLRPARGAGPAARARRHRLHLPAGRRRVSSGALSVQDDGGVRSSSRSIFEPSLLGTSVGGRSRSEHSGTQRMSRIRYRHGHHATREEAHRRSPVRPGQDAEGQPLRDAAFLLRRLLPRAGPDAEAASARGRRQGLRGAGGRGGRARGQRGRGAGRRSAVLAPAGINHAVENKGPARAAVLVFMAPKP